MALQKPAGTWTYEDLFDLPADHRYEIIDGELYELPSPTFNHAVIIANLMWILGAVVRPLGGRVLTGPLDVFIPGGNPVIPDIVVLLPDSLSKGVKRGIEGAPDLVIEVLSPSNRSHDRVRKRELYAQAGIPEYWIVDPDAMSVDVLRLSGDSYQTHCRVPGDEMITSTVLPDLAIGVAQVFDSLLS